MKNDNFLKQAARWVARMFGYKAESRFGRVVWHVFATSAAIVVLFIAIVFVSDAIERIRDIRSDREYERQQNDVTYLHDYCNSYVSPYVIHHDGYPSYLYNTMERKRTISEVEWVCQSADDSLAVYNQNDKRGYFNILTGEPAIPARYEKAWVFSEGVAWVMEQGQLRLIDHSGKDVIGKAFPFSEVIDGYCFHNGLCPMIERKGRVGLINKQGEWMIEPIYSSINYNNHGFWIAMDTAGHYGLLDLDGELMLPFDFDYIYSYSYDDYIYARRIDHIDQVYDFAGNLVNACSYDDIEQMYYEGDEFVYQDYLEGYARKPISASCKKYITSDYHYGLMDKDGNIITPPLYSDIKAISKDRYYCESEVGSVILDDKGRECGEKL